jgi:ABC transport permease subunit
LLDALDQKIRAHPGAVQETERPIGKATQALLFWETPLAYFEQVFQTRNRPQMARHNFYLFSAMHDSLKRFVEQLGQLSLLTWDFVRYLCRRPFDAQLVIEQLDSIGWHSLNVVNLTAIFTGMVLALQMGGFLSRFGAKIYISRIMGISLLREMGPVLTALMIGARVGAGIAAELGSMTVTEQVDAMRALASSPVKKLVVHGCWRPS